MSIYGNLMGGLGNQLFIAANTLSLSWDNNTDAIFNNTDLQKTARKESETFWYKTILRDLNRVTRKPKIQYLYRENGFSYKKISYKKNMETFGYFQSAKYFEHNREKILEFFLRHKNEQNMILSKMLTKITNKKKIAVHIRRGDYLNLKDYHPTQDIKYYKTAINKIAEKLGLTNEELQEEYSFLFFSDDIEWCKNIDYFKSLKNKFFVHGRDLTEMYLMSMCEHNIIANSSFSWWGSYFNTNENKIIVAPKLWFGRKGPQDWQDLYMEDWLLV